MSSHVNSSPLPLNVLDPPFVVKVSIAVLSALITINDDGFHRDFGGLTDGAVYA